jgi:cyclopropane-fatty-acyl-phospholipid synthase
VIWPDGSRTHYGNGVGTTAALRIGDSGAERRLALNPELALGELYMDGRIDFPGDALAEFMSLINNNWHEFRGNPWVGGLAGVRRFMHRIRERNDRFRARRNVAHHYDLNEHLYRLFLDRDMQYSCAYFETPDMSLDEAQIAKKRHIAAKLALKPGQRVLDIGSGWGGLGLYLAQNFDVDVTGVTLSQEQLRVSNRRAEEQRVADRVRFLLKDYREIDGSFDKIVSVGMFEHVGLNNFGEFFGAVRRLLADHGIALLHTIGKKADPGPINAWMERYIFPGAYLPALSELAPVIERHQFWLTDLEVLRLHYADTLAAWHKRFQAKRAEIAKLYDERFCRMWEFYLQACEVSFRQGDFVVFQLQLAKQIDSVELTRDYIYQSKPQSWPQSVKSRRALQRN